MTCVLTKEIENQTGGGPIRKQKKDPTQLRPKTQISKPRTRIGRRTKTQIQAPTEHGAGAAGCVREATEKRIENKNEDNREMREMRSKRDARAERKHAQAKRWERRECEAVRTKKAGK